MSRYFLFLVVSVLLFCSAVSGQGIINAASAANDVLVLQYALTLENLEAYFYNTGLSQPALSQAPFAAAGYNASVYAQMNIIAMEEMAHVTLLSGALGASSVPACTYNFASAFASVSAFLNTAAVLETTGTSAYDGAIASIGNAAYAQVAATISSVEARHTSYINQLVGINPVPYVVQPTLNTSQVVAAVTPFITVCPYNVAVVLNITTRPGGVTLGSNGAVVFTGPVVPGVTYTQAQQTNDLNVLQYALVLENLEAAFYNNFITKYTQVQWVAAGYSALTYTYLQNITSQENTHVAVISQTIQSRGGTPIPACTYNFTSITSINAYIATAYVLENTGVTAYDGAASFITDTALETTAATIVAVEARHTALLAILYNMSSPGSSAGPFPTVLDYAAPPSQVFANVSATGLLGTCPQLASIILPQQLATTVSTTPSVLGDPVFIGFQGQSFQVHGIPSRHFNLLSTSDVQFNAKFQMLEDGESMTAGQMKEARVTRKLSPSSRSSAAHSLPLTTAFSHSGTFLSQMGLKLSSSARIFAEAGTYTTGFSTATLNGKALSVSREAVQVAEGMYITHPTPSVLVVDTPTVSFTLVNADMFFNIQSAQLNIAPTADLLIDGLLGQTANPEWKVLNTREFKTHMVMDYLVGSDDIFSDDFVSSVYIAAKAE